MKKIALFTFLFLCCAGYADAAGCGDKTGLFGIRGRVQARQDSRQAARQGTTTVYYSGSTYSKTVSSSSSCPNGMCPLPQKTAPVTPLVPPMDPGAKKK